MAHVADSKKQEVKELAELIKKYSVVGIVDITNFPAAQMQSIRKIIRQRAEFIVSKKRLMKLAIEKAKETKAGVEQLEKFLSGMPAFIFSNEDIFKLAKFLEKNKSNAPAKAGQKAPEDITVNKGATSFMPGPIIAEMSALKIKAGVEGGKIAIKEDCKVAKKGDVITKQLASMLSRLGIEPMKIGLNLLAVYDNGIIYESNVLAFNEEEFKNKLNTGISEAFNLSVDISYTTKDNVSFFLSKAQNQSNALKQEAKIE